MSILSEIVAAAEKVDLNLVVVPPPMLTREKGMRKQNFVGPMPDHIKRLNGVDQGMRVAMANILRQHEEALTKCMETGDDEPLKKASVALKIQYQRDRVISEIIDAELRAHFAAKMREIGCNCAGNDYFRITDEWKVYYFIGRHTTH